MSSTLSLTPWSVEENDCQRFRQSLWECVRPQEEGQWRPSGSRRTQKLFPPPQSASQRMDLVISISSNTPVGTELVKEEQMAYWQYIGETRLHPEDQIPSWKVVWNFWGLTLCFIGGIHIGRETLKLTCFYSCPKLKAYLLTNDFLSTTDIKQVPVFHSMFF